MLVVLPRRCRRGMAGEVLGAERRPRLRLQTLGLTFSFNLGNFEGLAFQPVAEPCVQVVPYKVLTGNLFKICQKWSEHRPRICLKSISEEALGPPESHPCAEAPKTSFLMISAPFWDPILGPDWVHLGFSF